MRREAKGRAAHRERRYLRAAIVAGALIAALAYAAFAARLPFGDEFELRGVFSSANQLKPGNPVRLAGVRIGEVTGVGPGPGGTSTVAMRIEEPDALHADARLSIEPRLLFEGNFYVAVQPGTPGAPPLVSGATIPRKRTDAPVQIDQVMSALTAPARQAIRTSLTELAAGLGAAAGGRPGYEGLRRASREFDGALADVRQAARAAQGTTSGDARRALAGAQDLTGQLGRDPDALAGLVTNFNRVAAALAADSGALASSVRRLDEVLRVAPASLAALEDALPTMTTFANELRPALRVAPASLTEADRLLGELTEATRPRELPALVGAIEPVAANLPHLESRLADAFSLVTPAARCVSENVLPVLNAQVPDGATSSGRPVWQDLLHMAANLTQTSPGFDGNGGTLRISVAESENAMVGVLPGIGELAGGGEIQGVRPVWLGYGVEPEFRPDQWCADQPLPDLGARSRPGPPPGFESAPLPEPKSEQRRRQTRMAELLIGSRRDRRELLRRLLSKLPGAIAAGAAGNADYGDERGDRVATAAPDWEPAGPPEASPDSQASEPSIPGGGDGDLLSSLLDALLGGGGSR